MLTKISSCRHALSKKYENTGNSGLAQPFDKAHHWVQARLSPQAFMTFLYLYRMKRGQTVSPAKSVIASARKVTDRTIFNHTAECVGAGVLRIERRPIPHRNRNYTNVYIFLGPDGNDLPPENNFHEKQELKTLKPKTPAPVAREDHKPRERGDNNSPAMARLYHHNAVLQAENRSLRALVRGRHTWNPAPPAESRADFDREVRERDERSEREVLQFLGVKNIEEARVRYGLRNV